MASSKLIPLALAALALAPHVAAHGYMAGIVGKGSNTDKPRPSRTGLGDSNSVAIPSDCRGCPTKASDDKDGYVPDHAIKMDVWTTDDVRCAGFDHGANGPTNITVAAGETIEVSWDIPITHPGPGALYMSFDGDQTWVLVAQMIDGFIGIVPGEPDIWQSGNRLVGDAPNWKITMPQNLPASEKATLRGEWWNVQAPELYVTCIDIITTGPGAAPTDGFAIAGTSDGPSHLPKIMDRGVPYPSYQDGDNYVTGTIGWEHYVTDVYQGELGGPAIYDFGSSDYAVNVQMTIQPREGGDTPVNYPGSLDLGKMNPEGAGSPAPAPAPSPSGSEDGDAPTQTTSSMGEAPTQAETQPQSDDGGSFPSLVPFPASTFPATTFPQVQPTQSASAPADDYPTETQSSDSSQATDSSEEGASDGQDNNNNDDDDDDDENIVYVTKTVTAPAAAKRTPGPENVLLASSSRRRARQALRMAQRLE